MHTYQHGDKIHIRTERSGMKLVQIESVEGHTLTVEDPIRGDHYTLTLESATTGTMTGLDTRFDATVVDIQPDPNRSD